MDTLTCLQCDEPISGHRDKKFCNSTCRKRWENDRGAMLNELSDYLATIGPDEAMRLWRDSDQFADWLHDWAEAVMTELPIHADVASDDPIPVESSEAKTLFARWDERYPGLFDSGNTRIIKYESRDMPLPPDSDIDYAERTGDWSIMVKAAVDGMQWQLAKGFRPDLREFGIELVY